MKGLMKLNYLVTFALLFAALVSGCADKHAVRTIPDGAKHYFEHKIAAYEDPRALELFGEPEGDEAILVRKFLGALPPKYRNKFHHDPRLDAIAHMRISAFAEHESYTASTLVKWAIDKLGITGTTGHTFGYWAKGGKPKNSLAKALVKWTQNIEKPKGHRYPFGLALIEASPGKWGLSLVTVAQYVALSPVPKEYSPGDTLKLEGKILGKHGAGMLYLSQNNGPDIYRVYDLEDTDRLNVEIELPQEPGQYQLNFVMRTRPDGFDGIFTGPIYVGMEEPVHPGEIISNPPENVGRPDQWADDIVGAINAARAERNLPPLTLDEDVSKVLGERQKKWGKKRWGVFSSLESDLREKGLDKITWTKFGDFFENLAATKHFMLKRPDLRAAILGPGPQRVAVSIKPFPGDSVVLYNGDGLIIQDELQEVSFSEEVAGLLKTEIPNYDAAKGKQAFVKHFAKNKDLGTKLEAKLNAELGGKYRYEPTLDVAALIMANRGQIEGRAQPWLLSKLGISGVSIIAGRSWTREDEANDTLVKSISSILGFDEDDRRMDYLFGVYREPQGDGWFLETLAVVRQRVRLEPMAKTYQPGEVIKFAGQFLSTAGHPVLYMDDGEKSVKFYEIDRTADDKFSLNLKAPQEAGRYWLQVREDYPVEKKGKTEFWNRTILQMPIYVGQTEPEYLDEILVPLPKRLDAEVDWKDHIVSLFNKERVKYNLPALKQNPLADVVIAERMFERNTKWRSSEYQVVNAKLKDNDGGVLIGWGADSVRRLEEEVWRALLSPANRRHILSRDVTSIGVALNYNETYYSYYFMTEEEAEQAESTSKLQASSTPVEETIPPLAQLAVEDIEGALNKNKKPFKKCFKEEGMERYSGLQGKITIKFAIDSRGKVIAAFPSETDFNIYDLNQCIVDAVNGTTFPAPIGNGVVFHEQTFKFAPKGRKTAEMTLAKPGEGDEEDETDE